MARNPWLLAIAAWREYLDWYTIQAVTALRTGGLPPSPNTLTVQETAGAELQYYLDKGLPNYAELAVANLELRASRNEAASHFLDNATRWRRAAQYIREGATSPHPRPESPEGRSALKVLQRRASSAHC